MHYHPGVNRKLLLIYTKGAVILSNAQGIIVLNSPAQPEAKNRRGKKKKRPHSAVVVAKQFLEHISSALKC